VTDAENADWPDDPGWHLEWRAFVPGLQRAYYRRRDLVALTVLRSAYLTFPISLALFGVITVLILPLADGSSAALCVLGLFVAALAVHFVEPRFERPLRCGSEPELRGDYRTRTFLRITFANLVPVFAFFGAFVNNSSGVYLAGLVFAIPGLVRAAPTSASLRRDQAELAARGCGLSLLTAVVRSPSG
jgi:hypothetical protein